MTSLSVLSDFPAFAGRRHRRLLRDAALAAGILGRTHVGTQAILEGRDLVLDLLVGALLLVDLVLERLDGLRVGSGRRGWRRRGRQLHGNVHDRTVEEIPTKAEARTDQQETAQQAAQDQGPAGALSIR